MEPWQGEQSGKGVKAVKWDRPGLPRRPLLGVSLGCLEGWCAYLPQNSHGHPVYQRAGDVLGLVNLHKAELSRTQTSDAISRQTVTAFRIYQHGSKFITKACSNDSLSRGRYKSLIL